MKIIVANDHAAVELKNRVASYLKKAGHTITDMGVGADDKAHYPDMAEKAAQEYLKGGYDFGILFCGTGIGISISANKVAGIRCALVQDSFAAEMAKAHNNANFLAFGGRLKYSEPVEQMVQTFMDTDFEGGRHQIRVDLMSELDKKRVSS